MAPGTDQNTLDVVWAIQCRKTITGCNLEKGLLLMQPTNGTF